MVTFRKICHLMLLLLPVFVQIACKPDYKKRQLEVTATAYNSLENQTLGNPRVAAWGDTLRPGVKAIAVSRDLLDSGLTYGVKVKIEGLPGRYMVTDKMHSRWVKKIDVYMGDNVDSARNWGKKKVTISWKNN